MLGGSAWASRGDRAFASVEYPQQRPLAEWERKRARRRAELAEKTARREAEFTALIPAIAAQVAAEVSAAVEAALRATRVGHEGLNLAPTTTSMPGTVMAMATSTSTTPASVLTACAVRDGNLATHPPTTCSTICPGRAATSAVSTTTTVTVPDPVASPPPIHVAVAYSLTTGPAPHADFQLARKVDLQPEAFTSAIGAPSSATAHEADLALTRVAATSATTYVELKSDLIMASPTTVSVLCLDPVPDVPAAVLTQATLKLMEQQLGCACVNQLHPICSGMCSGLGCGTTHSVCLLPWDPGEKPVVLTDSTRSKDIDWGACVKQLDTHLSGSHVHGQKPGYAKTQTYLHGQKPTKCSTDCVATSTTSLVPMFMSDMAPSSTLILSNSRFNSKFGATAEDIATYKLPNDEVKWQQWPPYLQVWREHKGQVPRPRPWPSLECNLLSNGEFMRCSVPVHEGLQGHAASRIILVLERHINGTTTSAESRNNCCNSLEPVWRIFSKLIAWSPQFQRPPMSIFGHFAVFSFGYFTQAGVALVCLLVLHYAERKPWPPPHEISGADYYFACFAWKIAWVIVGMSPTALYAFIDNCLKQLQFQSANCSWSIYLQFEQLQDIMGALAEMTPWPFWLFDLKYVDGRNIFSQSLSAHLQWQIAWSSKFMKLAGASSLQAVGLYWSTNYTLQYGFELLQWLIAWPLAIGDGYATVIVNNLVSKVWLVPTCICTCLRTDGGRCKIGWRAQCLLVENLAGAMSNQNYLVDKLMVIHKLIARTFDVVDLLSRVQAVHLLLIHVTSSKQSYTFSEFFTSLVSVALLSEELRLSWDPGGRKFFGLFTQAETKRRNAAAPAYDRGNYQDHAYLFNKVCAEQDYYLNIAKICLNYNTDGDINEDMKHQVPWDPGGSTWHRLEVKPKFKEGGMLATSPFLGRTMCCLYWAWACREPREPAATYTRGSATNNSAWNWTASASTASVSFFLLYSSSILSNS